MHTLLIGALLATQQTPPPLGDPRRDQEWILLDGVAAQAGDGVVTLSQLERWVNKKFDEIVKEQPVERLEEVQQLKRQLLVEGLRELVYSELEAQAGEDMNIDAEDKNRMVQMLLDRQRREQGAAAYIDGLVAEGLDARDQVQVQRQELEKYIWRASVMGTESVAGRRPHRDNFIRPGQLSGIYRSHRETWNPPRVRLQLLVIHPAATGGMENARTVAEEARRRALEGEDFGNLVEELGAELRATRGLLPEQALPGVPDPQIRQFAGEAEIGDVSEPLVLAGPGNSEVLILVKLYDRDIPALPPFEQPNLQRILRRLFTEERSNRLLAFEHEVLRQAAFIWEYPGLLGAPGGPPGTGP